jgi:hypothetical protein
MDNPLVTTFCKMVRIDSESSEEGPFIDYLTKRVLHAR